MNIESRQLLSSEDVWKIIELINTSNTNNTARLEHAVEKLADNMVSRREFNLLKEEVFETKKDVRAIKDSISDANTTIGTLASIRKNWKFLAVLGVVGLAVFSGVYDLHTIALAHQGVL